MKGRLVLGAVALALLPNAALAEGLKPYIELRGGVTFFDDLDSTVDDNREFTALGADSTPAKANLDTGFAIEAAVGVTYNEILRLELAPSYRRASIDDGEVPDFPLFPEDRDGDLSTINLMANVLVEPRVDRFRPYVGGGVGFGILMLDVSAVADGAKQKLSDDTTTTLAAQAMAGIGYEVTENIMITAGYAYVINFGAEFDIENNAGGGTLDTDEIESHNVMLGLRYSF